MRYIINIKQQKKMKIDYLNLKQVNFPYQAEIEKAIHEVLESGWYLKGKTTAAFESNYAQFIGTQYCVACGNGLDALKLILMAEIELGKLHLGDEVIVPANTYIATILAISEVGLSPILVEPSINIMQIDDMKIEAAITPKTKAIMLVHMYGKNAMSLHIAELCQKYHLLLFEDNAQAHGCAFQDQQGHLHRTGSLGEAAAHSFYPGKNLGALGDAGAITTNNEELAHVIRALGNYGSSEKYVFPYRGLNSRIDELQAAALTVKLRHLDHDNACRQNLAQTYLQGLGCLNVNESELYLPQEMYKLRHENVVHIFPIFTPKRDELQKFLYEKGIGTMIHYPIPPHQQGCYPLWNHYSLPITERIHAEELSLPCNPSLTVHDIDEICTAIQAFFS